MELDKKLMELQEMIYRKHSLELKLNDLNEQYFYLKDHLRALTFRLEDLDIDLKQLKKASLTYLLYDIFTSKGKNVTKLEYDYKLTENLFDYIHSELIEVKNKLAKIDEYELEYKRLQEEKDKLLLESEKDKDSELEKLNNDSIKYKNRIRDINEAINSGIYLDNAFKYLIELLNKTKDWDNLDIFGRGLFMSLTKTTVFKHADEQVKKLHYLANKLVRDLKAVDFYTDIKIDVSKVIKYIDYFEKQLYDDIREKELLKVIEYIKDSYQVIENTLNILKDSKESYLQKLIEIEKMKHFSH